MDGTATQPPFAPLMVNLAQRRCLIVGGGRVAQRKIATLLRTGAAVTVVAPQVTPAVATLVADGQVSHKRRHFRAGDVKQMFLVVAATDNAAVNGRVVAACRKHGILVSSVDEQWRDGDFIFPAVAHDSDLTIALSSGGRAYRHAKQLKATLQKRLPMLHPGAPAFITAQWRRGVERTLAVDKKLVIAIGDRLRQLYGVHEYVVVPAATGVVILLALNSDSTSATIIPQLLPRTLKGCKLSLGTAALAQLVATWGALGGGKLARAMRHDANSTGITTTFMYKTAQTALKLQRSRRRTAPESELYCEQEYVKFKESYSPRDAR